MSTKVGLALHARGLAVSASGSNLLKGIDLALRRGRWTSIVGPNGAGKSTLLKALAGLHPRAAQQGSVELLGRPLEQWPTRRRATSLSWMGQNEAVSPDHVCYDIVMLGRMPYRKWLAPASAEDHVVVETVMRDTGCWQWRDHPVGRLSGGERQRVLLARALAVQADVMLMDEPLANLDPPHQGDWMQMVRRCVAAGITVVSVLHEIGVALQADDMVIVAAGGIRHHGGCHDPQTHAALEAVFEHRIRVCQVDGMWIAVPRIAL